MKTTTAVVTYIENVMRELIEHPRLYALDPAMLECLLRELDMVREYALLDDLNEAEVSRKNRYHQFLQERGFQAALVSSEWPSPKWDDRGDAIAKKVCDFWREYISSRQLKR